MRTRLDAHLEGQAAVRRQTRRRIRNHVGVLLASRRGNSEVRGIAVVNRQRERRPAGGDVADGSSVQSESVVLASVRPAGVSLAERRDLAEAVGALEREGLSWREARGRRIRVGRRGRPRPSCRGKCSRARAASRGKEEIVGMKTEGDALFGVGGIGGWGSRASP